MSTKLALRSRTGGLAAGFVAGVLALTTGLASADAAGSAKTLELWLGGILTTATPGTPYRKWVDEQVARLKQLHPDVEVNLTFLPANNDQLAAQVQSEI